MAIGGKHLELHTFTAASDMSASSVQYRFVKLVATGACLCTAETDVPVGVLQNSPARGEEAVVALSGITKLVAGAANLAAGDRVGTESTARAAVLTAGTSTGYFAVGRVLEVDLTASAGTIVTAAVECKVAARNA